jgi:hypothetical protein
VLTPKLPHIRLLLPAFPRYNQNALRLRLHPDLLLTPDLLLAVVLVFCVLWASSCAAPLGPGYLVEKQEIRVQFDPPAQTIHIDAEYQLRNTGNRAIRELEIILPTGRRVRVGPISTKWDGEDIARNPQPNYPRNSVLRFSQPWTISDGHSLHISYDILQPDAGTPGLSFAPDAFYLPASGWSPELPQARGLFGFGGVAPKNWDLLITVPEGFIVHSSGAMKKAQRARNGGAPTFRVRQTVDDRYPFVIAGRYTATEIRDPHQKIILWSRNSQSSQESPQAVLKEASSQLARTVDVFNSIFGAPPNRVSAFWIVECPVVAGCFSQFSPGIAKLLGGSGHDESSSELISSDTVMVDTSKGAPQLAAAVAPPLAASWLGYGRNPGFFEQSEPLSLLPIFAAARSREEIDGPQVRGEIIRRNLRLIPEIVPAPYSAAVPPTSALFAMPQAKPPETAEVLRAKSLLFFYALQDRYGSKVFHDAIAHMLYARASRGFNIDDLIAAFEEASTHQNVAEFVRHWMKRPGVPADFRSRYENSSAAVQSGVPTQFAVTATESPALHSKGDLP